MTILARYFTLIFFSCTTISYASTATLTFDGIGSEHTWTCGTSGGPYQGNTFVEKGFYVDMAATNTSTNSCPLYYGRPGTIHLDDEGTPFGGSVAFSHQGRFGVSSLDLISGGISVPIYDPATGTYNQNPYDNVLFQGFRNGNLVAQSRFSTGNVAGTAFTVAFGNFFQNLDIFLVSQIKPNSSTFCSPCGHVDLGNVTLAPVPIPGSLMFLGSGVALLVYARRQKRVFPNRNAVRFGV